MNKLTISFLILLTFTCHLSAQLPTTWYQHNVSQSTISYTIQGYKAEYQTVHKKGKWCKGASVNWFARPEGIQFDYEAFFNNKGLITSKIYYAAGKPTETIGEYTYNKRKHPLNHTT